MNDNSTPHFAAEYDRKVEKTIPQYRFFHSETIGLIQAVQPQPATWLDTGCGTGGLIEKAIPFFPNTRFSLADPSEIMLAIAKEKLGGFATDGLAYLAAATQDIACPVSCFSVITAIQSHHYLQKDVRRKATEKCFALLQENGVYVTFENIRPDSERGVRIGLERWRRFQLGEGKSLQEVERHIARFDVEYHPITLSEHVQLLKEAGFSTVEIFWASCMQAGFYAIK